MPGIDLNTDITYLHGVGPARAKVLRETMDIATFGDLLGYYPLRHIDRSRIYYTHELQPDMPYVQLCGKIIGFEHLGMGSKRRIVAHFTDGHGVVDLVWFNSLKYVEQNYKEGVLYVVFGKPTVFNQRFTITHPEIERADRVELSRMAMQPHYSIPEKAMKRGITQRVLVGLVTSLLQLLDRPIPEILPPSLVASMRLLGRDPAMRAIHFPGNANVLTQASYRLKFEELFFIQLNILRYTQQRQQRYCGLPMTCVGEYFNTFYHTRLPFPLTGAQKRVIREMRIDMGSGRQMNRLLQGDVGSGKTLVALMTMLLALDNGYQACIMAPTEILAEQHLQSFRSFLGDMPVRVELLTGKVTGKKRAEVLGGLKNGEVQILVGTHAVIEDNVMFRNLGLVVVDEQHRFGVAQRGKLWQKNVTPPHVLVMTATPIPRTLAMTVYGDLDVSVIDELPPGRKPVQTVHRYENQRADIYAGVQKQIELGRQAYVVFPLIKESEKIDLQNLESGYESLCALFPQYKLSKVHGQMKPQEKDREMELFARGETQILVATTVIEVGVNVPNASVMVIENADRFGLAQLHQLRGRVGRGAEQSYCILVTSYKLSEETRRRLQIMTETNDGFEIAEADMKMRGPGALDGTQQSGIAFELKVADLVRDAQIVQQARDAARGVLEADPTASAPDNGPMWQHLTTLKNQTVDWSSIS